MAIVSDSGTSSRPVMSEYYWNRAVPPR
jgi:hypothetical protein